MPAGKAPLPRGDDGLGKQHLSAVRRAHDSRRAVDRAAEIVAVALLCRAGMETAAHPERQAAVPGDRGHPALQGERGRHRGAGIAEHRVQAIPDHLHQHAAVRRDGLAAEPVVPRQRLGHQRRLGLPQPGAAFNVGEEDRDNAGKPRRRCRRFELRHAAHRSPAAGAPRRYGKACVLGELPGTRRGETCDAMAQPGGDAFRFCSKNLRM